MEFNKGLIWIFLIIIISFLPIAAALYYGEINSENIKKAEAKEIGVSLSCYKNSFNFWGEMDMQKLKECKEITK